MGGGRSPRPDAGCGAVVRTGGRMILRALTDGALPAGTGTVQLQGSPGHPGIFGGCTVSTPGQNTDSGVVIRLNNATGKRIFEFVTRQSMGINMPVGCEGASV